jgi:hypothetical protein
VERGSYPDNSKHCSRAKISKLQSACLLSLGEEVVQASKLQGEGGWEYDPPIMNHQYVCCLCRGGWDRHDSSAKAAGHVRIPLLAQTLVLSVVQALAVDAFFEPIVQGVAVTFGQLVDLHCTAILDALLITPGGAFLVLLRLAVPAGLGQSISAVHTHWWLSASHWQVLCGWHEGKLGGQFRLPGCWCILHNLAFWGGMTVMY